MKKIGVVLVCFHTPEETLSCAKMYANMQFIYHVVIVDNDATMKSKQTFSSLCDSKIEVLFQDENWGYSKGNNIGIKHLIEKYNVEYVVVSNSDVSVTQESLCCCIEILEKHNDIGAVAPIMKDPQKASYSCRYIDLGYLRVLLRIVLSETFLDKHTERFCKTEDNLIYQSFLPGSLFVAKSNALVECKGFDEEIFLYREEEILGKRLSSSGYKEAIINNISFIHKHNYKLENAKTKFDRLKLVQQSECVYFTKYIKSNKVQLLYLYCMQKLYLYFRYFGWVLRDRWYNYHD